jgi:SAM-dependent methyltransferase
VDARAWDERYAATELVWSATPNQFVEAELAELPPGRALDLAAGEGRNAIWLAERGWSVTAVDFSQVGLDKGRAIREGHPRAAELRIEWVHADVTDYHPDDGANDLALLAYLQVPDGPRRDAVRTAFSALKVGGTFFLVGHDATNLTEGTGGPQDPDVLYTAEQVLADLDGERFEVVRAERVARAVTSEDEHRGASRATAYDALVRLVRTA